MSTYYINADTGDNGTGDGSSGNPWETLAYAIDNSTTDDIIECQASTANYAWVTDSINNRTINGSSATTPAIFDGSGSVVQWSIFGTVTLENIKFQNALSTSGVGGAMFKTTQGGTFTFNQCVFSSITWQGSINSGFVSPAEATITSPIVISFTSCLFNDFTVAASAGRYMWGMRGSAQTSNIAISITFTNCILYFSSITPSSYTHLFFEHDTTVELSVTSKDTNFSNSMGQSLTWAVSGGGAGGIANDVTYSCLYNLTSAPSGTGNITDDPLFYDPTNNNFELRPTSPCIDTGVLV